ncbi:putative ABC transporter permease protein YurM [Paenibacillus baekrokdamisoli]|uniref:Putative ABC transporter permease protein YurM n=1 Tax=Paenibacillus baekrokdamisoli TaxID=1712516 RepID=A0A3G9JAK8_9BACL|nr:carbohydrate ABC transporter permease [Paenibacillus baekrokdamisoli]MBB3071565.1 raffinose/stachyose/melibiose transport system permease protein [Paenibacillus baekrokdamisoli]BBH21923.1 putative ABC transporter permease protein YurM [Paenibacillus baekrokdamisoli]
MEISSSNAVRKSGGNVVYQMTFYVCMSVFSLLYFYPMIWMLFSSFRENNEIFNKPFSLPNKINLHNWVEAWKIGGMNTYVINSIIVTSATVVCILLFSSLASFAFSKLNFKGSKLLLLMFVFGLFMPMQSFFIAQNYIFDHLHIKNTYWALILPYIGMGLPLAIFLLKAYLDSLPKEMMEAARIDGCSDMRLFASVLLPLLIPSLATVAIFSSLNSWNELLLALLYVQSDSLKTIPVGLLAFSSKHLTNYKLLFSALTIITIPMIMIYVFFHKHIVSGLTEGSLK